MTAGVAAGQRDGLHRAVGTGVIGVVLICVSFASPLALFKLLAFVDPSSSSGAAMRAGLAAQGGISGFLGGIQPSSSAASTTDEQGRSPAEASGQAATATRFAAAAGGAGWGAAGAGLGAAAGVLGRALEMFTTLGTQGAVIGADITNQAGIGHPTYVPDVPHRRSSGGGASAGQGSNPGSLTGGDDGDDEYPAWLDASTGLTPGTTGTSLRPAAAGPGTTAGAGAGAGAGEVAEAAVVL